jgi:hypothetical protein
MVDLSRGAGAQMQNSDAEIAKRRTREELRWPIRELTANLLRIVRGAGSPDAFADQVGDVVVAYRAYDVAFGHWPEGDEVKQALAAEDTGDWNGYRAAKESLISGALRLVAGRLLYQDLQARHGENEMMSGVSRLEEICEERLRQRRAELRATRTPAKRPSKRPPKRRPIVL